MLWQHVFQIVLCVLDAVQRAYAGVSSVRIGSVRAILSVVMNRRFPEMGVHVI